MAEPNPLEYAIQLERDGQAFYTEAANAARNPLGKRMFESLAADERRHEEALLQIAQKMDAALGGPLPKERLVTLFATLGARIRGDLGADAADTAVIEKAIGVEKASVEHYKAQAEQADAEAARSLYARLVDEELEHVDILTNTLTYLNATGDWFLWEEDGLLDGG